MNCKALRSPIGALLAATVATQLAGCASNPINSYVATDEHECMARVMYFESQRSSADGMLAVGTVVMNRLESGRYPTTVCGVVGQRNQFAAGALSLPARGQGWALAWQIAANVLGGQRHPGLEKNVMFFHTAGYHFPYTNMHYVLQAGGNVFYYKESRRYAQGAPLDARMSAYLADGAVDTPIGRGDALRIGSPHTSGAVADQPAE